MISLREIVFQALLQSEKEGGYLSDFLSEWKKREHPLEKDFRLAQEIAYGTMRMRKGLDFLINQLTHRGLNVKRNEKIILAMAIYQYYYMDKIPIYALVNESVSVAKQHCHTRSIPFINAILRKLERAPLFLPKGNTVNDLSIHFSYPEEYVSILLEEHELTVAKELLTLGNLPPVLMGRCRGNNDHPLESIIEEPFRVVRLPALPKSMDPNIYIQNVTPAFLIGSFARFCKKRPKRILDMCASPGGKAIAIHDLFPDSILHVNDISQQKIDLLKENLKKYGIDALYTTQEGQEIKAKQPYDLILIDAPCTNTGVFNKRPEARWRFSRKSLTDLKNIQKKLIKHAKTLLSPNGQIWYLTCSILKEENEKLVHEMNPMHQQTILPNRNGWDGGFGAIFS